ncbi:MAG: HEAT repeat domain-containing protein [bacterium]|nr:HEAT repeat domain-containing protein [bacterium]
MLKEQHLLALDQLANGTDPAARRSAHDALIRFEEMGELKEADFLDLLSSEEAVVRNHAIGALARFKSDAARGPLKALFERSHDPILLQELLEAFAVYGSSDFTSVVLKRLKPPTWWARFVKKPAIKGFEGLFEESFLQEHILLSALKYFLACDQPKWSKQIKALINHKDPMIRLNCLRLYDKIGPLPPLERLEQLSKHDPSPLVRDAAALMIKKADTPT